MRILEPFHLYLIDEVLLNGRSKSLASLEIKTETVLKDIEYLYGDVIGDDNFDVPPKLGITELLSLVGNQRLT